MYKVVYNFSGSVNLDTTMSVDAVVTKGGIKIASSLYTSTGAKGTIKLTEGNVFDMTFDLTKQKSEFVDIR